MTEADLAEEPPPPAAETAPAEAPVQAAAQPEPAAVAEPVAPPPAPAKPTPKPATTVAKASADEPTGPVKPKPPESDMIKPWWPDPTKMPANQLKLQYAGQVQGEQAIALLFSATLNIDTVKKHAQVRTGSGEAVDGQWELGKNPRLAVFRGVKNGRYTIVLAPGIADAKGFMLGTTLQGPVYIQGP